MTLEKLTLRGALLVLALALLASFSLSASAGTATSEAATIFACKKKKSGVLRVVKKRTKCKKNEKKMRWGTQGKRGKRGKRGAKGGPGAPGPFGPSNLIALGPATITPAAGRVDLYDLGYGVRLQIECSGTQSRLIPRVYVTNTAENTFLSSFSAASSYAAPILRKMATIAPSNSVRVSAEFASTGTATASSQVFASIFQLSDAGVPKVFYATIVPWAEAQTTTCKFAGGLVRVAG